MKLSLAAAVMMMIGILPTAQPVAASDLYTINEARPIYAVQKPTAGKALIYLIRTGPGPGAIARKIELYSDGKFLGLLMANSFITVECEPGRHELVAVGRNAAFLQTDVRADGSYFVIAGETSDMPAGRLGLRFSKDEVSFNTARTGSPALATLLDYLADLHPITITPEGMKWEQEHHDKFLEIITKSREKMKQLEYLKPEDGFALPPWQKKA